MKEKTHDIISYVLGSSCCAVGITDIKEVLNIVLIVLGIVNILLVLTLKIISIIKDKKDTKTKVKEIEAAITEASERLNDYDDET